MKTLHVELTDKLALELDKLVEDGWFTNESEIVRLALVEFIQRYRFALLEQFQYEDIAWALQQKVPSA